MEPAAAFCARSGWALNCAPNPHARLVMAEMTYAMVLTEGPVGRELLPKLADLRENYTVVVRTPSRDGIACRCPTSNSACPARRSGLWVQQLSKLEDIPSPDTADVEAGYHPLWMHGLEMSQPGGDCGVQTGDILVETQENFGGEGATVFRFKRPAGMLDGGSGRHDLEPVNTDPCTDLGKCSPGGFDKFAGFRHSALYYAWWARLEASKGEQYLSFCRGEFCVRGNKVQPRAALIDEETAVFKSSYLYSPGLMCWCGLLLGRGREDTGG